MTKILVIDDSAAIRTFLKITLSGSKYEVIEAANAADGLALYKDFRPDMVILDLGLPDRDGLDLLPDLKMLSPETPVIILTVRSDPEYYENAYNNGASAYITKPFLIDDLLSTIKQLAKSAQNAT